MEINNKLFGALLFIGNHQGSITKMSMCCCKLLPRLLLSKYDSCPGQICDKSIKKLNTVDKFLFYSYDCLSCDPLGKKKKREIHTQIKITNARFYIHIKCIIFICVGYQMKNIKNKIKTQQTLQISPISVNKQNVHRANFTTNYRKQVKISKVLT